MNKEILFKLTKKDFVFEYFSGSGAGGQHRNKHKNSCRCKHLPSGAIGVCQDTRSKDYNTKIAFNRMAESKKMQDWIKIESCRKSGKLLEIENKIDYEIENNVKIEIIKDGKWTQEK